MIFIAYRCRRGQEALYVSQLPGEGGGADYGYGTHPDAPLDGARCLTEEQASAFKRYVTPLLARDESITVLAVPARPCTCTRSAKAACPRSCEVSP